MPDSIQAGDFLAGRYQLDDLLAESRGGRFWHAYDSVLHRPVAVHIIPSDDDRARALMAAARSAGPLGDRRLLHVLDADMQDDCCFVVNEWGEGVTLDLMLDREGPLSPRRAAWLVAEVGECLSGAHDVGLTHGRLVPENVLVDHHGQLRLIGFGVDAALLGLPPTRVEVEVTDLVALLYAALTGRWPGVAPSALPTAPTDHGAVLRPRRVRAGIPRVLDAMCDQALNPLAPTRAHRGHHDLTTAHGVTEALREYVGDVGAFAPTGAIPVVGARLPPLADVAPAPPPPDAGWAPAELATETEPGADPEPDPPDDIPTADPDPDDPDRGATASTDLPTQAGMPVFHDDSDDVEWLRARSERPPPPPPLERPAPRPLFAPEPPDGQPARRVREGSRGAAAQAAEYWPWDTSSPGGDTGHGTGGFRHDTDPARTTGGGWVIDDDTGEQTDFQPGRSWFRLALVVALFAVLLAVGVAAYTQLRDDDPGDTVPGRPTVTPAAPVAYGGLTAQDFDPQGDEPREENPDLVPLAVDGDVSTAWRTATYKQQLGPAGLKTGVGLIVDLGATRPVRSVEVSVAGVTGVAAYVTGQPPTGVDGLTAVGQTSGSGELTIELPEAASGRYVTIWLTALPEVEDGFRGTVNEIRVLG